MPESGLSPEILARGLLKFVRMQAPVDLYELSEKIGLRIKDVPSTGFDGALVRVADRPRGIIGKRETIAGDGRKRFTVAHEIGHYILPGHGVDISICAREQLDVARKNVARMEKEANKFASELLLPSATVRAVVNKFGTSMDTCSFVAGHFDVSLTASVAKCVEVSDAVAALVVADDGVIKYFQRGDRWKYFISHGEKLKPDSLAARLSPAMLEVQGRVPGLAWTFVQACPDLWEESVLMPRYNRIITLLREA